MARYFGIIEKKEFALLAKKEQVDHLVATGACQWISSIDGTPNGNELFFDLNKIKTSLIPSKETVDEFHSYIIEKYNQMIKLDFVIFFRDFKETIFGLDTKEQKRVALNSFKEIYAQINNSNVDFISGKKSKGLVEEVNPINRFEKLQYMREAKKTNLCPLPLAMEYFYGNEECFNSSDFMNEDFFKDAINFELRLKILVNLNNRFHFEEDLYFSEYGDLKKLFNKYDHVFLSFEAFVWTKKTIANLKVNIPSQIDSLYRALEIENLIYKHKKKFKTYVLVEHKIELSKIRHFEELSNLEHDKRVLFFRKELKRISFKS